MHTAAARPQFDAFVSYSHSADGRLAPAVQRAVQRFATPWYRLRGLRLFRDESALSADPSLWGAVQQALATSSWFVLLASPQAAASLWVRREVDWWLRHRDPGRLLIVVTEGAVVWTGAGFDATRSTALPPELIGAIRLEPRWIDLTWVRYTDHLDDRDARFRDAVASIAAPLRGLPKDAVFGEDVRQHRRTRRTVRTAVALLVSLALGVSALAAIAVAQRDEAVAAQRLSAARSMITQADAVSADDPRLALQLAVAAHHLAPGPPADAAITQVITSSRYQHLPIAHDGGIRALTFSRDGSRLLTVGDDETAVLWDAARPVHPAELLRIPAPAGGSTGSVSPDGQLVVLGSGDGELAVWDVTDPAAPVQRPALAAHQDLVSRIMFSPDGTALVSVAVDGTAVLRDMSGGGPTRPLVEPDPPTPGDPAGAQISSVDFSPDGASLAITNFSRTVRIWDLRGEEPVPVPDRLAGHEAAVWATAWSPDGRMLATTDVEGNLVLWDVAEPDVVTRRSRPLDGHTAAATSVLFSPNGNYVLTGALDDTIAIWDLADPAAPALSGDPMTGQGAGVLDLAFVPGRNALYSADENGRVVLWDFDDVGNVHRSDPGVKAHDGAVSALTTSGELVLTGGDDGLARLWRLVDGRPAAAGPAIRAGDGAIFSAAVSPDGRTAAIGDAAGRIALYDLTDPSRPVPVGAPFSAHDGVTTAIAFAPDRDELASAGDDGRIRRWDIRGPQIPIELGAAVDEPVVVVTIAYSADGTTLATGRNDSRIRLFDLTGPAGLEPVGELLDGHAGAVLGVRFVPVPGSAALLSVGADGDGLLWPLTDSLVAPPPPAVLDGHEGAATSAAFSPDGGVVVTAGADGKVRVWDVGEPTRPRPIGEPLRPTENVATTTAFAAGGRTLLVGTGDGLLVPYDAAELVELRRDPVAAACSRAGGALPPDAWAYHAPGLDHVDTCAR